MDHTNYRNPRNWAPRGQLLDADRIANPKTRQALIDLCTAMAAWLDGEAPKPPLSLVSTAFATRSRAISFAAATALRVLLEDDPDAKATLLHIFKAAPAHPRMMIVRYAARPPMSAEVIEALIQAAFTDRSRDVRAEAAWSCEQLELKQFLPQLRQMLADHTDSSSQRIVSTSIAILENGYHAEYNPEIDFWYITVSHFSGSTIWGVSGTEVAEAGLEAVARRYRRKPPKTQ